MATRLKLYTPPEEETFETPDPDVRVRLGDLLPLVSMAQRMNFIWLKDFLDDEVAVSDFGAYTEADFFDDMARIKLLKHSLRRVNKRPTWPVNEPQR